MSLCFKGSIARDLESDTLRSALEGLFYGDKEANSKKRAKEAAKAEKESAAAAGGAPAAGPAGGSAADSGFRP